MSQLRAAHRWRRRWRSQRHWSLRDSVWQEIATGLRGQLYVDRAGGPADTVYLAGTARSGTSWISEVINHDNAYRMIHEPLRPDRLRVTSGFRPRHYLRPNDQDPDCLRAMRTILSGRARSIWTDKYNRKVLPAKRLIREVRGNQLLPWIHRNFPDMPMILLLRHPCAVASSQLKWGREWPVKLERFLAEGALVEDLLGPFVDEIAGAKDEFERHVLGWAIENYVPLRTFGAGEIHVAFYERFCVEPAEELARLFQFLGRPQDEHALARLGSPSSSSRKDSAIISGQDLLESWRRSVSSEQVDRAVELLSVFGLDRIYGAGSMPLVSDPLRPSLWTDRPDSRNASDQDPRPPVAAR
jgi:hypothetical protein